MSNSSDKTDMTLEWLEEIVKAHKPHPKSLLDEESKEAYNEEAACKDFGQEFFDQLKKDQKDFKGDWWQLALIIQNLELDIKHPDIQDENRLKIWNNWRNEEYGLSLIDDIIHLEHACLAYFHLEYAYLADAHLEHAKLCEVHLQHSSLADARLKYADLCDANLEHAYLEGAHLENALLAQIILEYADLSGAHLEHANLFNSYLEHADFSIAHLERTNLFSARLRNTKLFDANMDRADVRGAKGLRFDRNRVEGIDIEGNAPDPWSVLRKNIPGHCFLFTCYY